LVSRLDLGFQRSDAIPDGACVWAFFSSDLMLSVASHMHHLNDRNRRHTPLLRALTDRNRESKPVTKIVATA